LSHGFLRSPDGTYTIIDVPGAGTGQGQGTGLQAINSSGAITGEWKDSSSVCHGYIRTKEGELTLFDVPGAGTQPNQGTRPYHMNDDGVIVGIYQDKDGAAHGFLRDPSGEISTSFSKDTSRATPSTYSAGINSAGAFVGSYSGMDNIVHGFVRFPDGEFTTIDYPFEATKTETITTPNSINDSGVIVGEYGVIDGVIVGGYMNSQNANHCFLRSPEGVFITIDPADNILASHAWSVNATGILAGWFTDQKPSHHGFTREQDGTITIIDVPSAGTSNGQGTTIFSINDSGTITGWYIDAKNRTHGFVRFNQAKNSQADSGNLDAGFGNDGIVPTSISDGGGIANGIAVQTDEMLVVAGSAATSDVTSNLAVVHYDSNGSLDTSFGTNGIVTTTISDGGGMANGIAVQADGKLVVAGSAATSGVTSDLAVVRYNGNGSLDPSFGTDGIVTTSVSDGLEIASGVSIQADGKIVVAGYAGIITNSAIDIAVVRYNSNGNLDTSFGTGGIVTTSISDMADMVSGIAVQADGKIVVVGNTTTSGFAVDLAVVRYNTDGSLDNSFGTSGIVTTSISNGSEMASGIAVQSDGKIVVTGSAATSDGRGVDLAVVRYNTDGSLDNSFGTSGIVTTSISNGLEMSVGIAIQADGKLVVVGSADASGGGTTNEIAVVRYNNDGSLDTSFGTDGIVTTSVSDGAEIANGIALQADGRVVVAGTGNVSGGSSGVSVVCDVAVVCYNNDGSLDTSFGTDGIVTTSVSNGAVLASGIAVQADGRIVVTGSAGSSDGRGDFAVMRYNTGGS